jgi:hypothetical protein
LDSDRSSRRGAQVLLCLHAWGAHDHPSLTSADRAEPGNGLLLFIRVDDFEVALASARKLVSGGGRGARREPEHRNNRVLAPGPGRILRPDQRARGGFLTHHQHGRRMDATFCQGQYEESLR